MGLAPSDLKIYFALSVFWKEETITYSETSLIKDFGLLWMFCGAILPMNFLFFNTTEDSGKNEQGK